MKLRRASVVSGIAHDACLEAPPIVPDGVRWWEHLDPAFHAESEPFQLGPRDAAQVQATAAADVVLRTLGACLVGATALPFGYRPSRLRRAIADRPLYTEMAESGDATRFFPPPKDDVEVTRHAVRLPGFRPNDGVCEDLRFESPYVPVSPRERADYLRHRDNRVAHVRSWRHHDGPRPTVIAIHGFSADLSLLNEWFFALPWFYGLGLDVCLLTLPFHGKRQTRFSPFSGHGFFAGGISRINEAFGQAVCDARILVSHLERTGVRDVGVTGVSLGGFTSALLAATEPRLRFVIPNVPVASVADLVLEWAPIGQAMRAGLARFDLDVTDARHMLAVSNPLTYAPVVDPSRLFIVGGVGDRLAPPKHSRLIWDHWDRCRIHWFPGSHLVHLDRGAYLRQIARFLRSVGFFDRLAPPAPRA